jgi:subfamily B ATP-binding cassette protein HlyB/CyaB
VLVDGIDISLIDAAQLRSQVGVVLQENLLFNRSVRENIAITDPAAPLEAVMRVAQLAGAHEFISELPEGYDTLVGEQGTACPVASASALPLPGRCSPTRAS